MTLEEAAQRLVVVDQGLTWLRTPYHPHGRVIGLQGGVDCGMLLAEVFERAGVLPHIEPGNYPVDWHMHRSEERYLAAILQHGREISAKDASAGDIAVFRFGRTWSHGGILVKPGLVLHAYRGLGVVLTRLQDYPLAGREPRYFTVWGG